MLMLVSIVAIKHHHHPQHHHQYHYHHQIHIHKQDVVSKALKKSHTIVIMSLCIKEIKSVERNYILIITQ